MPKPRLFQNTCHELVNQTRIISVLGIDSWNTPFREKYPELVFGVTEAPEGREFAIQPLEIPPIQDFIKDKYKFYLGLSNDEIGYIIPKSEWDTGKPYLYNDEGDTYGEENSLGPETGPFIYKSLVEVINDLR